MASPIDPKPDLPVRCPDTVPQSSTDSTQPALAWIGPALAALEEQGLRRRPAVRQGPQGPRIVLDGRELVNFGSNDYLALAADERLAQAAADALQCEGFGSGASPLVTGFSHTHLQLQRELANFEKTEAALVFASGYAANIGTIAALVGPGDVVFTDRKNHASLLDGCRLARADVRPYPHGDFRRLEGLLAKAAAYRRRLIVTDGLFSIDGDLAPLGELAHLAQRYEAMLLVDEAHATGVFGAHGRGTCEAAGIEDQVHVRIGTLSKALGSAGGFVAGRRELIEWLVNRARSYVFSTAPPALVAAAARAALHILRHEAQRGAELLSRAEVLRAELNRQGWDTGRSASQIIPLLLGTPRKALELCTRLRERGLLVPAIRPPTVPEGEACLRISLTLGHSEEMIAQLVRALAELRGQIAAG